MSAAPIQPPALTGMAALIVAERAAYERFDLAAKGNDAVALGREPTEAEEAEWDEADDAQAAAVEAVMSMVPASPDDLRAQIDLLGSRVLGQTICDFNEVLVRALLRSIQTYVGVIEDMLAGETRARLAAEARALIEGQGRRAAEAKLERQKGLCQGMQRARDDTALRAGRAEQALRDMALDQDRLRRRVQKAEALLASMGELA